MALFSHLRQISSAVFSALRSFVRQLRDEDLSSTPHRPPTGWYIRDHASRKWGLDILPIIRLKEGKPIGET